jgi:hypothetical protein
MDPEWKYVVRQRFVEHVPDARRRHGIIYLLGNGSVSTFPWQRIKQNNRESM